MGKAVWKAKAKMYEKRFEELFKLRCLTTNKATERQIQGRMDIIRELQVEAIKTYNYLKTKERKKK
jgi:hypothetical protein